MIRRGTAEGDRAELESELAGAFWADDGSHESQALRSRWGRLVSAAARGEATEEDAQEMVDEEADAVAESAESAAEMGRAAAVAVGEGRWDDAIDAALEAARLERQYGDAPAWGGLEGEIKALPEYVAAIAADSDYQSDDRSDEEIVADVERMARESCAANINAGAGENSDEWIGRYAAAYRVEIAEWCAL